MCFSCGFLVSVLWMFSARFSSRLSFRPSFRFAPRFAFRFVLRLVFSFRSSPRLSPCPAVRFSVLACRVGGSWDAPFCSALWERAEGCSFSCLGAVAAMWEACIVDGGGGWRGWAPVRGVGRVARRGVGRGMMIVRRRGGAFSVARSLSRAGWRAGLARRLARRFCQLVSAVCRAVVVWMDVSAGVMALRDGGDVSTCGFFSLLVSGWRGDGVSSSRPVAASRFSSRSSVSR